MSTFTDRNYGNEYVQFIKSVLMNSCYNEFCKQVCNLPIKNGIYVYELLNYKDDKTIWDNVMKKVNSLFQYYLHLSTDYLSILPRQQHIVYSHEQLANTYETITFQEYVDEKVNMQQIGYREYQTFIRSMNDYNFKKKLIEKYRIEMESRTLKNHIVYVIQLLLSKQINNSEYFTSNEVSVMDISMNPIHYYQYLFRASRIREESTEKNTPQMESFLSIEKQAMEQIDGKLGPF
jgi:hypothetical protein